MRIPQTLMGSVSSAAPLLDGRVLLAGNGGDAAAGRLTAGGVLDASFDGDGARTYTLSATGLDELISLVAEPDGRFLAVGHTTNASKDVAVVRLDLNGVQDPRVGTDGVLGFGIGTGADTVAAVAAGHDGKVAIGTTSTSANADHGVAILDGTTIADYSSVSNTWTGASALFGVCLQAASNATPAWSVDTNATCTASDSDPWQPVTATTGTPGALAASTAANVANGSLTLRWGLKVALTQSPGSYVAPVVFDVVAP